MDVKTHTNAVKKVLFGLGENMYVSNQQVLKSQGKLYTISCQTTYFLFNSNLWESMGLCDPSGFWSVCT